MSKSLYDGTKSTMRLSNITSKLRTVSSTLANTNPFSSKSQDQSIAEELVSDAKHKEGVKKIRRRTRKRITSTTESSTSAGVNPEKPERKKRKKKAKDKQPETMKSEKTKSIPQTTEYIVQEGDSFISVAAQFDITPSELCRINKFLSRTLFVGQVIKVPIPEKVEKVTEKSKDKSVIPGDQEELKKSPIPDEGQAISAVTMTETATTSDSVLCDVIEEKSEAKLLSQGDSLTSSFSATDTDEWDVDESSYSEYTDYAEEENDPLACQYLKFDSNFVVDLQNSISGIILVTTDMFVFKPNDEEQYPLENHCKQIPLNQFRTVAVYRDPSVMYFTKRGAQTSSSPTMMRMGTNVNNPVEYSEPSCSSISIKDDDATSNQPLNCPKNGEDNSDANVDERIMEKNDEKPFEEVTITEIQSTSSLSILDKNDLDENPLYLCILASTNSVRNIKRRRHPHWFTIQSEEYWFLIPKEKAKVLFDFLLTCQFHGYEDDVYSEGHLTDTKTSQLSVTSNEIRDKPNISTNTKKLHSKSFGSLSFLKSFNSPTSVDSPSINDDDDDIDTVGKFDKISHHHNNHKYTHYRHNYHCHFVVVPKTFDWILPRIGSSDDQSRALVTLRNHKQKRVQSSKEFPKVICDDDNNLQQDDTSVSANELHNDEQQSLPNSFLGVTTNSVQKMRGCHSMPSMEEEKAALQTLKLDSIDWEGLKSSFRSVRDNLNKLLVSSKELELKEQEEEQRNFMSECIKLAEPESLPLPPATSNSEIFDAQNVRDLLQNLTPDAEGLDWVLTYSTSLHGFSLRSLYRRCANSLTEASMDDVHNSIHSRMKHARILNSPHASNQPCIIIIRTSVNEIFGAMLNTHPYPSGGRFYGNGSSFVFRWVNTNSINEDQLKELDSTDKNDSFSVKSNKLTHKQDVSASSSSKFCNVDCNDIQSSYDLQTDAVTEELAHLFFLEGNELSDVANKQTFQKFVWSGKNSYFINGGYDSLTIGCSKGHSAIYIDDVLLHGRSDSCETFDNPQLTSSPDFVITTLEIWSFI
ncbi:unnamed protein product [Heterobilharzia americana]|nr:unnamed protein product [Heterobilharzia americana]